MPPPHVAEQLVHGLHALQVQFTVSGKKEMKIITSKRHCIGLPKFFEIIFSQTDNYRAERKKGAKFSDMGSVGGLELVGCALALPLLRVEKKHYLWDQRGRDHRCIPQRLQLPPGRSPHR